MQQAFVSANCLAVFIAVSNATRTDVASSDSKAPAQLTGRPHAEIGRHA
jgi:hypothetical protein